MSPATPAKEPACLHCRHFRLRQGEAFPYQCAYWGVRCGAGQFPSRAVFVSTGTHCPYFEGKPAAGR